MSQASEAELLMLGLINEERTSRGLDPLTINADLNDASEDHSQWMLDNDVFSHTGVDGSRSRDRIEDADYALEGNWRTAENIGWQSERGAEGIEDDVRDIHESLMDSPGHRANLLNPDLEDIGIGIEVGDFDGYDAVMITQNFGTTDAVSDAPEQDTAPDSQTEEPLIAMEDEAEPPAPEAPDVTAPPVQEDPPEDDVFVFEDADTTPTEDDGMTIDTHFEGTIFDGENTITVQDMDAFNALIADLLGSFGWGMCDDYVVFA